MKLDLRKFADHPAETAIITFLVLFSCFVVWVGWTLLPRLETALNQGGVDDINKLTLTAAGVFGVYFLVWRTWIADRQRHVAQEQLYMGLLTKAIEQLGATRDETFEDGALRTVANREVRLGAIYALEKLACDYMALHWQIMEVLCAYVRTNAGDPAPCSLEIRAIYAKRPRERSKDEHATLKARTAGLKPSVDVQAALTVMGRRSEQQKAHEQRSRHLTRQRRLDLSRCQLAGADLALLDFDGAIFTGSCLEAAILFRASFRDALLDEAHLQGAKLESALLDHVLMFDSHLQGARLGGASLRFAHAGDSHFEGAHLAEADLEGARLHGAHLHGAALRQATGLNDNDLSRAHGDCRTVIPEGLSRPAHWPTGGGAAKENPAA